MKFKTFLWLLALASLWGPSFLFVKVAVVEIPPLTLVAIRVTLAAVLLYLLLRMEGQKLPQPGLIWKHFAISGLLNNALPYVLLSWGELYIDSALAAILIGATPLFTLALAHFTTANDRLTPTKAVGVMIGFVGVVTLFGPALGSGVQATMWGLLASLAAALCYGGGILYSHKFLRGLPSLVGPTAQLTTAAIFLAPLALLIEQPYTLALPSWNAIGSLLLLTIFSTVLAFVLYFRAMESIPATVLSTVTYLVPIVGMVLGVIILNEQLGWNAYLGSALVLLGILVVNGIFKARGGRRSVRLALKTS